MTEISRLSGGSDAIEFEFVKREATLTAIMELAIRIQFGGLSISNRHRRGIRCRQWRVCPAALVRTSSSMP